MKVRLYKQKFTHRVRFFHELNMNFMTWIKIHEDEPHVWPWTLEPVKPMLGPVGRKKK